MLRKAARCASSIAGERFAGRRGDAGVIRCTSHKCTIYTSTGLFVGPPVGGSNPVRWTHPFNVDTDWEPVPVRVMCALGRSLYTHSALSATRARHMPRCPKPPRSRATCAQLRRRSRGSRHSSGTRTRARDASSQSEHPPATPRRDRPASATLRLQGCPLIIYSISPLR